MFWELGRVAGALTEIASEWKKRNEIEAERLKFLKEEARARSENDYLTLRVESRENDRKWYLENKALLNISIGDYLSALKKEETKRKDYIKFT